MQSTTRAYFFKLIGLVKSQTFGKMPDIGDPQQQVLFGLFDNGVD